LGSQNVRLTVRRDTANRLERVLFVAPAAQQVRAISKYSVS
jgi:hypothetical protein